jgi:hypothetical protein
LDDREQRGVSCVIDRVGIGTSAQEQFRHLGRILVSGRNEQHRVARTAADQFRSSVKEKLNHFRMLAFHGRV